MPLFAQQCSHSNICIPTKLLHFASLFLIFLVALQCPLHSSASFYYITTPSGNQLTAELLSNFRMPQQSAASMMPVRKNMLAGRIYKFKLSGVQLMKYSYIYFRITGASIGI